MAHFAKGYGDVRDFFLLRTADLEKLARNVRPVDMINLVSGFSLYPISDIKLAYASSNVFLASDLASSYCAILKMHETPAPTRKNLL